MFVSEIVLTGRKRDYNDIPTELVVEDARVAWDQMQAELSNYINSSISRVARDRLVDILSKTA